MEGSGKDQFEVGYHCPGSELCSKDGVVRNYTERATSTGEALQVSPLNESGTYVIVGENPWAIIVGGTSLGGYICVLDRIVSLH